MNMQVFHFILLVVLGVLRQSMVAVARQMADVDTGNFIPDDLKELVPRQGYPNILLDYEIRCAKDKEKTPWAPGTKNAYLSKSYCGSFWGCKSDGREPCSISPNHPTSLTRRTQGQST